MDLQKDQRNGETFNGVKDDQRRSVLSNINQTTNQSSFRMIAGGKELTADARSHGQFIRSKQREGNVLRVPVNCFFGSTSYKDNFVPAGNIGR